MKTKICSKCKKRKKLSKFHKNKLMKNRITGWCKKCFQEYKKINKEKIKAYQKWYNKQYKEKAKLWRLKNAKRLKKLKKEHYEKNKKRILKTVKAYRAKHPKRRKNSELKANFDITLKEYYFLLKKQNGRCAICGQKETRIVNGKLSKLAVDHKEDKIRGLLCMKCNRALGMFKDDIQILQNAIRYLKKQKTMRKKKLKKEKKNGSV